jgi:hypothetical protein
VAGALSADDALGDPDGVDPRWQWGFALLLDHLIT